MKNCYTFNFNKSAALFQDRPRQRFDLHLRKVSGSDDLGYKVAFHEPGSIPLMGGNAIQIREDVFVRFQHEKRFNLREPYGKCVSDWSEDAKLLAQLKLFPRLGNYSYSEEACQAFGTPFVLLFGPPGSNLKSNYTMRPADCPHQCELSLFSLDVKQTPSSSLRLRVTSTKMEEKNVISTPAMSFEQLVGNIGGLMGLWMGASLLTMIEILELSANVLCKMLQSLTKRNRILTVEKHTLP